VFTDPLGGAIHLPCAPQRCLGSGSPTKCQITIVLLYTEKGCFTCAGVPLQACNNNLIVGSTNVSPKSFEEAVKRRFEWVYLPSMTAAERATRILQDRLMWGTWDHLPWPDKLALTDLGAGTTTELASLHLHAALFLCELAWENAWGRARNIVRFAAWERVPVPMGADDLAVATRLGKGDDLQVVQETLRSVADESIRNSEEALARLCSGKERDAAKLCRLARELYQRACPGDWDFQKVVCQGFRTLQAYLLTVTEGMTQHSANRLLPALAEALGDPMSCTLIQALKVATESKGTPAVGQATHVSETPGLLGN
jgi:hypothetical protein